MIIELLLLVAAFFGAWLVLQPTERFTYARKGEDVDTISPALTNVRSPLGYALCIGAMITILLLQV